MRGLTVMNVPDIFCDVPFQRAASANVAPEFSLRPYGNTAITAAGESGLIFTNIKVHKISKTKENDPNQSNISTKKHDLRI